MLFYRYDPVCQTFKPAIAKTSFMPGCTLFPKGGSGPNRSRPAGCRYRRSILVLYRLHLAAGLPAQPLLARLRIMRCHLLELLELRVELHAR